MGPGHLVVAVLLALLAGLGCTAYAEPVDPSWLDGLYDDADSDDAVRLLTGESHPAADVDSPCRPSDRRVLTLAPLPPSAARGILLASYQLRAPPVA